MPFAPSDGGSPAYHVLSSNSYVTDENPELTTCERFQILTAAGLVSADDRRDLLLKSESAESEAVFAILRGMSPADSSALRDDLSALDYDRRWKVFQKITSFCSSSSEDEERVFIVIVGMLLYNTELESRRYRELVDSVDDSLKERMIIRGIGSTAVRTISLDDLYQILTSASENYRDSLIHCLRGLGTIIPRAIALDVFNLTKNFHACRVIKAGLFDSSELSPAELRALSQHNNVGSDYESKVLGALEERYPQCALEE